MYNTNLPENDDDSVLTSKEYWSKYFVGCDLADVNVEQDTRENRHRSKLREYTGSYEEYLWDKLLDRYFQHDSSKSIVEVGSAPGTNLIQFNQKYGYQPFGIEYTDDGARINRSLFKQFDLEPENVLHNDFTDEEFIEKHRNEFDIVVSFGFLEHFSNPKEIVDNHISILKPGGLLFVTIPNFRYLNYLLKRFFGKDFIDTHNLKLMDLDVFKNCFDHADIDIIECRYHGGFQFPQPTHTQPWKRIIEKVLGKLQLLVNLVFRLMFKDAGWESKYFSFGLVCIAKKREV